MNFINGQPDLNSATIQELKALAYDGIAVIQNAQSQLDAINQVIAQKSRQEQEEQTKKVQKTVDRLKKEENGNNKTKDTR